MSDYVKTTNFTAKDALTTGDPAKLIKGSLFDTEYDDIATAIATKYDSGDMAVNATAAAGVSVTTLINPANLKYTIENATFADGAVVFGARDLIAGAGLTGGGTLAADRTFNVGAGTGIAVNADDVALSHLGIEALIDPNADRIAFWDDSAGAVVWLTVSTGLSISGTNLTTQDAQINHDSLSGFVGNEHVDHTSVTLTAGTGLSGGGNIAANRTFNLDISGLTAFTGGPASSDGYLLDDGGVMKRIAHNGFGIPIVSKTASATLAATEVNSFIVANHATTPIVLTIDASTDAAVGNVIVIEQRGAAAVSVVGSGATINSPFTSDQCRTTNSVIVLVCTAANTWTLYGDAV